MVYGGAERQATYLINNGIFDKVILLEDEVKYKLNNKTPCETMNSKIIKLYLRPYKDNKSINQLITKFSNKDIVVSFLERSNIINIRVAQKTNHKVIISVRNYLSERYAHFKYVYRMHLIKKYYPKADKIIVNSNESKEDLIRNFNIEAEKIKVIYNIIDLENVDKLKTEKINPAHAQIFKNPVIINVGSLIPQKAQIQLIEAFSEIKKEYPDYKMVIIGSGGLEKKIKKTIFKLNLENEVFLLGNIENPFKYIYKSNMFILNSEFEGFPNVLLESIALGIPIISKNCLSGPKELMDVPDYDNSNIELTKYGFIFPKKSSYKNSYEKELFFLIRSMCSLIDMYHNDKNSLHEMKKKCKEKAEQFSKKIILEQWKNELSSKNKLVN